MAAVGGQLQMVREMLDKGADVNLQDNQGSTPLHLVIWKQPEHTVELATILIWNWQANLDLPDNRGRTPLHLAACTGHLGILRELLRQGVSLNITDNSRSTPLQLAVRLEHLEVIQELLERGADANLPNDNGLSPLHSAIYCGNLEIVRKLLAHGTDKLDGALSLAIRLDHLDIAEELLTHETREGEQVKRSNSIYLKKSTSQEIRLVGLFEEDRGRRIFDAISGTNLPSQMDAVRPLSPRMRHLGLKLKKIPTPEQLLRARSPHSPLSSSAVAPTVAIITKIH
jgi:ankyrin repeat protein